MAELKDRYASALFELSVEKDVLEESMRQAVFVQSVLQDRESEAFMRHPHVPDTAKKEFVQRLFADRISADLMGFLYLAIEKSREELIVPALKAYLNRGNRYCGKMEATVVSATALSEDQVSALYALLCRKLNKQVEIQFEVDPALIGGFYIHMDGRLIDRTVRTQLINMKECIKRGGVE
ncbi:MAG: ATP synthase F1 subunit delta [Christensenellales bacterium]|jgi:F-type H+-transporting ATPase subunit delta